MRSVPFRDSPRRAAVLAAIALGAAACNGGRDLDSGDPERRAAAVRALSRTGDRDLAVLLVAQRDPSPVVRRAAAEVFSGRGGPGAAVALGKLLADPDPAVIAIAARGLAGMSGEPHAKEALVTGYAGATPA
jgi:HEAT repeat protein